MIHAFAAVPLPVTMLIAFVLSGLHIVAAVTAVYLGLITMWAIYWMFHGFFHGTQKTSLVAMSQQVAQQQDELTRLRTEFSVAVEALSVASSKIETMRLECAKLDHEINELGAAQFELESWRSDFENSNANEPPPAESAEETPTPEIRVFAPDAVNDASELTAEVPTVNTREYDLQAPDDLTLIWGIGPVNQQRLNEHGVYRFDQIAAWQPEQVEAFNEILGFRGRIEREGWVQQAKDRMSVAPTSIDHAA